MRKIPLLLVVSVLALSVLACQFSIPGNRPTQTMATPVSLAPAATLIPVDSPISGSQDALVQLYARVSPGVVSIRTVSSEGGGQGSGFVYDRDGHILTNYHVVDGAEDLEVDFLTGLKVRGKVVASDLDSDLAVVKVDVPPEQLTPLTLGDSDALGIGQTVIAIGNPFGLSGTMTVGIISAKGRTLDSLRESPDGGVFTAGDIIQTDAAINPGNSGGPLLNLAGEVIGINRAIRTTGTTTEGEPVNSGIGFAISINIVKRVTPALISVGQYDYPYLGLSAMPEIGLMEQEALGLPQATGAYVVRVVPGGPSDEAGLRAGSRSTSLSGLLAGGDLIIGVDGREVRVFGDLLSYLMTNKSPGDTIILTILRDNDRKEATITLGKRP